MRIKLKDAKDITKTFEVDKNMTIGEAKKMIGQANNDWMYCGDYLEDDKTFSDYDIEEGCQIITVGRFEAGGGFGLNTIDVSKNNTRIVEFVNNAPYYRTVGNGLSIQAICGSDCEAKDEIVYCPIGFVRNYDVLQNIGNGNIKCPACKNLIYPKNFGFLRCKYKIDFTKWEGNKPISNSVEGEADEKFKVFSEYSGNANFTKLIFTVTKK